MRYSTPSRARQVVVLDNASIHKTYEFVRKVNVCGGIVLYLPPYCFDLPPLDNDAFGATRRWLQATASGSPGWGCGGGWTARLSLVGSSRAFARGA